MYHLQQAKKSLNTNENTLEITLTAVKFCSNYHRVPWNFARNIIINIILWGFLFFIVFLYCFARHAPCNLFVFALPCCSRFSPLWALRGIFGLVYCSPCFLTYALFSRGLCGQFLFPMLFALLLTLCPLCGLCGLYFYLACVSPCF